MIDEHRFRALCRKDLGSIEASKFQAALEASEADPVPVVFEVGIDEQKIMEIPRADAELYAKIAKEERAPEDDLLKYIKPEAHNFVKFNRSKMVLMLKEIMLGYPMHKHITLIWPLWTPDNVSVAVADAYVRKYS